MFYHIGHLVTRLGVKVDLLWYDPQERTTQIYLNGGGIRYPIDSTLRIGVSSRGKST